MTDQLRQAAQQALEALETLMIERESIYDKAIGALRTALEQQAEPPPEWPLIKNILAVFGLDAISFVAKWQAAQQAEPVAWMFQHDETGRMNYVSNDGRHTPDLFLKTNLRYALVCPLYAAPPQRPWVGLTDEDWGWVADRKGTSLDSFDQGAAWAQARLQERNK